MGFFLFRGTNHRDPEWLLASFDQPISQFAFDFSQIIQKKIFFKTPAKKKQPYGLVGRQLYGDSKKKQRNRQNLAERN